MSNAIAAAIRSALAAGPLTEGRIEAKLRGLGRPEHADDYNPRRWVESEIHDTLCEMMGTRCGAETTGEIVIVGWRGGCELLGLRAV